MSEHDIEGAPGVESDFEPGWLERLVQESIKRRKSESPDELAELRRQLADTRELMGRKLAAVSVAAMMDTQFTHEQHKIDQSNEAWSPAYSDTMRRTAECIELRSKLATRDARIAELEAAAGAMRDVSLSGPYHNAACGWYVHGGGSFFLHHDGKLHEGCHPGNPNGGYFATFKQADAARIAYIEKQSTAGRDYAERVKALEAERDQLKQDRDDWKRLYEIIGEAAKNNPLGLIAALKSKAVVFVDAT